jgi:sulfur carrier protein
MTNVMELIINGENKQIKAGFTVADLLHSLGFEESAHGVAVAVNDTVVPRPGWHKKALAEGDAVEIIRAVQGG